MSVNLNQNYISNQKAERPQRIIAAAPDNLPSFNLCKDSDMNKKMQALNNDIYQDSKREKNKGAKKFWSCFGGFVLLIAGIRFFRNRF